jgi:hypothetical protein
MRCFPSRMANMFRSNLGLMVLNEKGLRDKFTFEVFEIQALNLGLMNLDILHHTTVKR